MKRIEPAKADIQLTAYRCMTCKARFREYMLVGISVERYVAQMNALRCPQCGGQKLGLGEGRTLEEDAQERIEGTEWQRAANWVERGERGQSSEAIHAWMTGGKKPDMPAPRDLDDVRRCILLLHHVPEWLDRMTEMQALPQWKKLAPRWRELQEAFLQQAPNLDASAPRAAQILSECLS